MACQVELLADCGDVATLARSLFIQDKEDTTWLSQCAVSLSSCGNLLAVGYKNRLCFLSSQWISSLESDTFIISWSGNTMSEISYLLTLPICPTQGSSQNGPDWFCIVVGFKNGSVVFYTNTGHQLINERYEDKPVLKITCHTGLYGTMPDDVHILYENCQCIISGASLFQTLRFAKSQLAKVQAGILSEYTVDSSKIQAKKWTFNDQETIIDAGVVGLELKNTYDHLLSASTYGGYDTWYRSVPPAHTLIVGGGARPYVAFHYALEGGAAPPLQDVARAVASRIKSALPGWLGGSTESPQPTKESKLKTEALSMRSGLYDSQRQGSHVCVSPDRRLAAVADSVGRVAVLDVSRGHLIRLFKGYRDAQCAFVQVFEPDAKKPQLATIKETRRALFLIIYNPKKGLIDIRLMFKGTRVAVFTATKNGKLLYNTCGLVGAEQSYTHKKLNLPRFQCVLIDPDGKLKKFSIPFFFALEGEHSERSKDLHILREMRAYLKGSPDPDGVKEEVLKRASKLQTLDLKKHCIEMLYRNYNVAPSIVMACLGIFWSSLDVNDSRTEDVRSYFRNLVMITLFYRRILNENVDDMLPLSKSVVDSGDAREAVEESEIEFRLLDDDTCILERLLILAHDNRYKERQHARVTFADHVTSSYKDFVACFQLEGQDSTLRLKPDLPTEKLSTLSAFTFKAMFKVENVRRLSVFVKESNIDAKEIVRLGIVHFMNTPIDEISVELTEQFVAVVYYLCRDCEAASSLVYNEVSPWWQQVRDWLVDMPCPLRSMIVAMACKAVVEIYKQRAPADEDQWESVTKECAKWGILIGKLEDISILSIVMMLKETFRGRTLPKLYSIEFDVNLKYIYSGGRGSVTELVAKWLCSMGVAPEAVVASELDSTGLEAAEDAEDEDTRETVFLENHREHLDDNPEIFKWMSLLRQQFPYSTIAAYVVANMSWEYAIAWQKDVKDTSKLAAVVHCLKYVWQPHIKLGLMTIIWQTYISHTFEACCKLVNKVGKLPKDVLCLQDVGMNDADMVSFLEHAAAYLAEFRASLAADAADPPPIRHETIWDDSAPSLVEVAQRTNTFAAEMLSLGHQMATALHLLCHFRLKLSRPLESLFDVSYQYVCERLPGAGDGREGATTCSDKVKGARMKLLTKVVRAALELVVCEQAESPYTHFDAVDCMRWAGRAAELADSWGLKDYVNRQLTIGLYQQSYDSLADEALGSVRDAGALLPPLLLITAQRLKRSLQHSADQSEWIASMPPNLYVYLSGLELDQSIPAHSSLQSTAALLRRLLARADPAAQASHARQADLMLRACDLIVQRNL